MVHSSYTTSAILAPSTTTLLRAGFDKRHNNLEITTL
jgi:hypothetical protein